MELFSNILDKLRGAASEVASDPSKLLAPGKLAERVFVPLAKPESWVQGGVFRSNVTPTFPFRVAGGPVEPGVPGREPPRGSAFVRFAEWAQPSVSAETAFGPVTVEPWGRPEPGSKLKKAIVVLAAAGLAGVAASRLAPKLTAAAVLAAGGYALLKVRSD